MAAPARGRKKIGRKILIGIVVIGLGWWAADHWQLIELPVPGEKALVEADSSKVDQVEPKTVKEGKQAKEEPVAETAPVPKNENNESKGNIWTSLFRPALDKVFRIKKLETAGIYSIHPDMIHEHIDPLIGLPAFDVNIDSIAAQIRHHPRVKRAILYRQLPSTFVASIEERREIGLIVLETGLIGVDDEGILLSEPLLGWPLDLPLVTGYRGDKLIPGEEVKDPLLLQALAWLREASCSPRVGQWLCEISISEKAVRLYGGNATCAVIPGVHSVVPQVAAINAWLLDETGAREEKKVIDLSFPGFLIVREDT